MSGNQGTLLDPGIELPGFLKERLEETQKKAQTDLALSELRVYEVPIELIDFSAANPNEMSDETFNTLAEEIDPTLEESPGFIEPVHLVPLENGRYLCVGGEHRTRARKSLGYDTVPAILLTEEKWKSEEFREFMLVRLNVLRGKISPMKFMPLYEKYKEKHGDARLQRCFAVVEVDFWKDLTGGVKNTLQEMGASKDLLREFDSKTSEVKTIDDLSAILNGLFQKYGNDLKYSFMVFTYGGREHIMVKMSEKMYKSMRKITTFCRDHQADINLLFEPIVAKMMENANEQFVASLAGSATKVS